MSNIASGKPPRVAPQVYDAIRALRAGKNDEAIVKPCAISAVKR